MKTSEVLIEGTIYTRKELQQRFNLPAGGNLYTGVFQPNGHQSIWLFITEEKSADRTQYRDKLENDLLQWDGQSQGGTDRKLISHQEHDLEILVFYRGRKQAYPKYGFRYEGTFNYVSHSGGKPTQFIFQKTMNRNLPATATADLAVLQEEEERFEGRRSLRLTNYYERDPKLRTSAVAYHGCYCAICGFDFEAVYGALGVGYIEVHHITPVSTLDGTTPVNYKEDMITVCANCHRMLHRNQKANLSPDALKAIISQGR